MLIASLFLVMAMRAPVADRESADYEMRSIEAHEMNNAKAQKSQAEEVLLETLQNTKGLSTLLGEARVARHHYEQVAQWCLDQGVDRVSYINYLERPAENLASLLGLDFLAQERLKTLIQDTGLMNSFEKAEGERLKKLIQDTGRTNSSEKAEGFPSGHVAGLHSFQVGRPKGLHILLEEAMVAGDHYEQVAQWCLDQGVDRVSHIARLERPAENLKDLLGLDLVAQGRLKRLILNTGLMNSFEKAEGLPPGHVKGLYSLLDEAHLVQHYETVKIWCHRRGIVLVSDLPDVERCSEDLAGVLGLMPAEQGLLMKKIQDVPLMISFEETDEGTIPKKVSFKEPLQEVISSQDTESKIPKQVSLKEPLHEEVSKPKSHP